MQLTQGEQRKRESCQVLTLMQNFKIPSTVLDQALTKQVVREQVDRWEYEIKTDSWKKQKHLGVLRERLTHFDKNCWNFWIGHSQNIRIWTMWKTQNGVVHGIFSKMLSMPLAGWYPFSFTKIFKSIVKVLFNRSISPRTGGERLPDAVQKP